MSEIQVSHDLIDWFDVPVGYYPDGVPYIKASWQKVNAVKVRPYTLDDLTLAMFYVDALRDRGSSVSTLILTYIPGGRQDRYNDEGDVLFTLKYVAEMINARNFTQVVVADCHSLVSNALINNLVEITPAMIFDDMVLSNFISIEYDGVIAPDAGATKRAEGVAKALGIDVYQGWKQRDVDSGKILNFGLQELPVVGHYLVVDDICDGGGTFLGLADRISDYGCTADLYVTHGIFSQGFALLLEKYDQIITTDSRFDIGYYILNERQYSSIHTFRIFGE